MRILILDDHEIRHRVSEIIFSVLGVQSVHVYTAADCIAKLDQSQIDAPFDVVFLDHDLQHMGFVEEPDSLVGHGREVSQFIRNKLHPIKYPKRIIVHSMNEKGAMKMVAEIRHVGIPVLYRQFWSVFGSNQTLTEVTGVQI